MKGAIVRPLFIVTLSVVLLALWSLFMINPFDSRGLQHRFVVPAPPTRKLLIVSASRSGSTFVHDILSLAPKTVKIFEPLHVPKNSDHCQPMCWEPKNSARARSIMSGIFSCNATLYSRYLSHKEILRSRTKRCRRAKQIVVKTIRLSMVDALDWVRDPEVKILFLVRDPRARWNSLKATPWNMELQSLLKTCPVLERDLDLTRSLNEPSRIRLQRYEDLAQAPDQTFGEIFNFTGIPFTKGIQEAIHEHTSTALYKRKDRPVKWMFSTYRQQSFKHDHWKEKEELAINDTLQIEAACHSLLKKLNYSLFRHQ